MNKEDAINLYNRVKYLSSPEARMTCEFLEKNFPEVRESEDERVREWLVDYFKAVGKSWIHRDISPEQVIAYLEKQKEPKPALRLVGDGLISDPNAHFELESDQKNAEWDELQAEFRNINEAFEDGKKEVVDNPKMYGLCKPAEWSDEDEAMIEDLIRACHGWAMGTIEILPSVALEYEERLKSLRSRPIKADNWKPGEEHIIALERAIVKAHTADDVCFLAVLRDNLKELMQSHE